jgi:hypothetical protein
MQFSPTVMERLFKVREVKEDLKKIMGGVESCFLKTSL